MTFANRDRGDRVPSGGGAAAPRPPGDDLQDAIDEFLAESVRGLERVERGLREAAAGGDHRELVVDMFRTVHTLKGTASLLGFSNIEATSHATETLLTQLRNGWRQLDPQIREALAAMCASIRGMLATIERARVEEREPRAPSLPRAVGALWRSLGPSIRDLAARCGKVVRVETDGDNLIADSVLIDHLKLPLIHLIRNAVGHGIEEPAERRRMGKREEGLIVLRAAAQGSMLSFEVSDDGAGIDARAVRATAMEMGLLGGRPMIESDDDLLQLLFTPGFTTVRNATSLAGRGVGLDIVRSSVEAFGGRVDVRSQVGRGTSVTVRVPARA
jgi:chemotaxis protein histidine kinase CheA